MDGGLARGAFQRPIDGRDREASRLIGLRLQKRLIELHHVDLGAGYTAADWPDSFLVVRLPEPLRAQREERRTWDRAVPPLRKPRPLGKRPNLVMPW